MEHRYTITGMTPDGEKVTLIMITTLEHEDVEYFVFADVKELEDDEVEAIRLHFFVCTDETLSEVTDRTLYELLVDKYNSFVEKYQEEEDDDEEEEEEEFDYTFVNEDGVEEEYTFRVIEHIETEDGDFVAAVNVEDLYEVEDENANLDDEISVYFFAVYDAGDTVEVEFVDDDDLNAELLELLIEPEENDDDK